MCSRLQLEMVRNQPEFKRCTQNQFMEKLNALVTDEKTRQSTNEVIKWKK